MLTYVLHQGSLQLFHNFENTLEVVKLELKRHNAGDLLKCSKVTCVKPEKAAEIVALQTAVTVLSQLILSFI